MKKVDLVPLRDWLLVEFDGSDLMGCTLRRGTVLEVGAGVETVSPGKEILFSPRDATFLECAGEPSRVAIRESGVAALVRLEDAP